MRRLLFVVAVLVVFAASAHAQFRAGIQGTVTDTSGAAVLGATLTITNQDTNVSRQATTNQAGFYNVSELPPGRYKVAVSFPGFKARVMENVNVSAEVVRGLDLVLEPGDVKETVTVSAEATTLQTENAEVYGTLTTLEIRRLPQVGRDPYELVRLAPGVFGLGARDGRGGSVGLPNTAGPGGSNDQIFATENRPPVTANGQRVEANNFQIDGVNANSQAWGGAAVVTPNQEAVKEIRVVANNYSAEYGRNTGALVQVVSQTGTNAFHGSGFFKRNTPGLNAFQRWGGPHGENPQRVEQLLSQWGGSIGGPIRKDKLFFFFSYETARRNQGTLGTTFVETPEFVSLIKSKRPNSIAAQILSFPGMTPPRIVKTLEVRDVGSPTGALGQIVTAPTGGGLDGIPDIQRAQIQGFDKTTAQQFNTRIDYQVTQKDLVAFSMYLVPNTRDFNEASEWGNTGRPNGDFTSARRNTVGTLLWTRTLSPAMINEARFNVTRWYFDEIASNPNMPWGIPRVWVPGPDFLLSFGPGVGPGVFFQTTYNFRDTLSKVVNAHVLKFGGDVISEQNNDRAPWAGRSNYFFWDGNLWSFANDAPTAQNAFLDPRTGAFTELGKYVRSRYYALFLQDDWKFRPNLTFNLGLRWEYFTPLRSNHNNLSNLILGPNGDFQGARIRVGGDLYNPDRNNFGPQLGFAWSPGRFNKKLAVRGGFGVGFNRLPGSIVWESRFNPPDFAFFGLGGSDIRYALASNLKSFGFPANPAATRAFDPATNLPVSGKVNINLATLQDVPQPYGYRYSLDMDYDVGAGWVASLGYQASANHKLPRVIPYQLFVGLSPQIERVRLLRTDVNSNYNALLIGVRRRFTRGYLLNAEYRWSKSLDTCSSDHNCVQSFPFDQKTEYGPSDFDVTNSFRAWGTWELPILRGRNDALGKAAGGWELSGILTASSGFPWTAVFGGPLCSVVVPGGGVCPLRPIAQTRAASGDTSNETFMRQFGQFPGGGPLFFTPPPAGSFTGPPRPGIGRNSFRGPHYFTTDLGLFKQFGLPKIRFLGEAANIEIRANAYNLFNKLNLAPFGFNSPSAQIDNPDFGRATAALAGRVVEFQGRFSF